MIGSQFLSIKPKSTSTNVLPSKKAQFSGPQVLIKYVSRKRLDTKDHMYMNYPKQAKIETESRLVAA